MKIYGADTAKAVSAPFCCMLYTVFENALSPRSLDRNGLLCDNILELAGNPFTISPTEELHPDPTYDVNANLPWWIRSCRWVQKVLYDIAAWYNGIPWTVKLFTGIGLLAIALVLTLATGGGGMGVLSVLLQVAIGVGVGVGLYTIGSLLTGTFTWEGFANAALDAFLITSAIVFVSASVNFVKHLCRSKHVSTAELASESKIKDMPYDDMLANEKAAYDGYSKHGWKGNYPGQTKGIKAGKVYKNKTGVLPKGTYHEFDINLAIPGIGRDATRFVVSDQYVVYLTRDHYMTLFRIIK